MLYVLLCILFSKMRLSLSCHIYYKTSNQLISFLFIRLKHILQSFITGLSTAVISGSTREQLDAAQLVLERVVMSHIYIHALYPNGDGDVSRDQ